MREQKTLTVEMLSPLEVDEYRDLMSPWWKFEKEARQDFTDTYSTKKYIEHLGLAVATSGVSIPYTLYRYISHDVRRLPFRPMKKQVALRRAEFLNRMQTKYGCSDYDERSFWDVDIRAMNGEYMTPNEWYRSSVIEFHQSVVDLMTRPFGKQVLIEQFGEIAVGQRHQKEGDIIDV